MTAVGPASSEAGSTLVELLASLVVMALFSLMLATAFGGRVDAWARMDRDTAAAETVEAAQGILTDRIQRIWPASTFHLGQPLGPDFDGRPDQMTFLAPAPEAQGRGPLRRYRLSVDVGGDLVLESVSDLALDRRQWSERRVLLQGVQAMDLAYLISAPGQAPGWRSLWQQPPVMPALIRVRLAFADGDRRRWPDMMARPLADIDDACRLDIGAGRCRGR
jgi:general secretion pathway protein J